MSQSHTAVGSEHSPLQCGPFVTYYVAAGNGDYDLLAKIEHCCPGAMVYVYEDWKAKGHRLHKVMRQDWYVFEDGTKHPVKPAYARVHAPSDIAFAVEQWLGASGYTIQQDYRSPSQSRPIPRDADSLAAAAREGLEIIRSLPGLRTELVLQHITPYQARAVCYRTVRGLAMVAPCGSGKTLSAICSVLARAVDHPGGAIVILCPAKARRGWEDEFLKWSWLQPYRMKPQSAMRKSDQTLESYLASVERPVVIFGMELLSDHVETISKLNPVVLVIDEIHRVANPKRWAVRIDRRSGQHEFTGRQTAGTTGRASSREVRSYAAMRVSQLPSLRHRLGLTATPQGEGLSNTWGVFDLLAPLSFGRFKVFCDRYTGGTQGEYGYVPEGDYDQIHDAIKDELRYRLSHRVYEVSHEESHADLPRTRIHVQYLAPEFLTARSDRSAAAFYRATKAQRDLTTEQHAAAKVEVVATRKRKWVLDEVMDSLESGGKVVVYVYLQERVEWWADYLGNAISRRASRFRRAKLQVRWAHGGVPLKERESMGPAFANHDGACLHVVSTGAFGESVDGYQAANKAFLLAVPINPRSLTQILGRVDRRYSVPDEHGGLINKARATEVVIPIAEGTEDESVIQKLIPRIQKWQEFWDASEADGLAETLLGLDTEEAVSALQDEMLAMF